MSERQKVDLHGLWRQEEHASSIIRSFSPQQRDRARFIQSLKAELRESEFDSHGQRQARAELIADLRKCENDRVKVDAQSQMLLERSAKQSEEILRLRMDLNRRESELRRSIQAVGLGGQDAVPREVPSFDGSDHSYRRADFCSLESFDGRSRVSDQGGAVIASGGGIILNQLPFQSPPSQNAIAARPMRKGKRNRNATEATERGSFKNVAC